MFLRKNLNASYPVRIYLGIYSPETGYVNYNSIWIGEVGLEVGVRRHPLIRGRHPTRGTAPDMSFRYEQFTMKLNDRAMLTVSRFLEFNFVWAKWIFHLLRIYNISQSGNHKIGVNLLNNYWDLCKFKNQKVF